MFIRSRFIQKLLSVFDGIWCARSELCVMRHLIFGPSSVHNKPQTVQLKSGFVFMKMAHFVNKK